MTHEYYLATMDVQGFRPDSELMVFPVVEYNGSSDSYPFRFGFDSLGDCWYFAFDDNGILQSIDLEDLENEYLELIVHQPSITERDDDSLIYSPEREYFKYRVIKKFYAINSCTFNADILYGEEIREDNGLEYLRSYSDNFDIFFADDYGPIKRGIIPLIEKSFDHKSKSGEFDDPKDLNWTGLQITSVWQFESETFNDYYEGPETNHYMSYCGILDPEKIDSSLFLK